MDDLEEIQAIEATLTRIWGSQDQAYSEFEALVSDYNESLFGSKLPPVNVAVGTRWMVAGPMGGSGHAAATYNPSSSDYPANILLGAFAISSKETASIILVHEMIHHWEQTVATDSDATSYPPEINKIVAQCYADPVAERRWRAAHSTLFIAKAYVISVAKGWEIAHLLTGKKYYDWLGP